MCCHRSVTSYGLAGGNLWELQVLGMRCQGQLVETGLGRRGYKSLCPGSSLSDIFDHSLPFLRWYLICLTLPCHFSLMKNISFSAANPDLCPQILLYTPSAGPRAVMALLHWPQVKSIIAWLSSCSFCNWSMYVPCWLDDENVFHKTFLLDFQFFVLLVFFWNITVKLHIDLNSHHCENYWCFFFLNIGRV